MVSLIMMMIAMMRKLGENQFVGDDERGEVFHHFSTPVRPRPTLTQVTKCFVHGLCYKVLRGHLSRHSRTRLSYNCAHLRSTKESLTFFIMTLGGTGWYLVVLGQYRTVGVDI